MFEGRIPPTRVGLRRLVGALGAGPKLFIFEAGNQTKWIALMLMRQAGVKWISQSSGKTDKVDARKLAYLGRGNLLPRQVHIVEGKTRQLRELVSAREQLQGKRVALINALRGYIRQEGVQFPAKFFQRAGWAASLARLRLGAAQRVIFKSFMEAIEALKRAEEELTAEMLEIRDRRCELLEMIPATRVGE